MTRLRWPLTLAAALTLSACAELAEFSDPGAAPAPAAGRPAKTAAAHGKPAPAPAGGVPNYEKRLREAREASAKGDHQRAYVLYSEALTAIQDRELYARTVLDRARVLVAMGRHGAALASLSPLPDSPRTLDDCRKMVLAAEILQKMGEKGDHVESLYEVALDNQIGGAAAGEFRAHGYAALGRLYLANRKTDRAARCFARAESLYNAANRPGKARTCREIREYIR